MSASAAMNDDHEGSSKTSGRFAAQAVRSYPRVFRSRLHLFIPLSLVVFLAFAPKVASSQQDIADHDPGLDRLQVEIERLAQTSRGTVGVGVRHIETARQLYLNRSEQFPMASTFKLPLAVQLLTQVDKGAVSLDKIVTLRPNDLRPGSGRLVKLYDESQPAWSLRNLLELMLIHSDNSATDVLWKEAGGGEAVMARLASLGIRGISVDRPISLLFADALGVEQPPSEAEWTLARFRELTQAVPRARREAAVAAFFKDQRDTATPKAMVDLLVSIWRHEALSPGQSALLIDIMYRCATGKARLRGMLPLPTKVAHKTGTLSLGVTNDVGIIALPRGAGHIVVAVFVKQSAGDISTQERAIAAIARAAYDYFASNPAVQTK